MRDGFLERVRGIEPLSSVWKTGIITIILYPRESQAKIFEFTSTAGRPRLNCKFIPAVCISNHSNIIFYFRQF